MLSQTMRSPRINVNAFGHFGVNLKNHSHFAMDLFVMVYKLDKPAYFRQ